MSKRALGAWMIVSGVTIFLVALVNFLLSANLFPERECKGCGHSWASHGIFSGCRAKDCNCKWMIW